MHRHQTPKTLAYLLQNEIYYLTVEILRTELPPPITDTPEAGARQERVAFAKVTALVPANPVEADRSAHFVTASGWPLTAAASRCCMRLMPSTRE